MPGYHIYTGERLENYNLPRFERKEDIVEKYCYKCGRLLPISNFRKYVGWRAKKSRTGYALNCNDCHAEWRKLYPKPENRTKQSKKSPVLSPVCEILISHRDALKDDPERLSTDFLKKMIGGSANDCEDEEGGQP